MIINNAINFSGKYHFLQKQKNLPCAYCGQPVINEAQLKELQRNLEGKKAPEIAQILEPYIDIFPDGAKGKKFLTEVVTYAKCPKYKDWKFKELAMLGTEEKIFDNNYKKTLENIFNSILFSVEHTTPKSENGVNRYFNYLPMHISCNNDRKSKNYAQLVIVNPDFVANIRKSLLEIKNRISSDKLGQTSYGIHLPDDYFSGIKENIDKQGISKEFFADI